MAYHAFVAMPYGVKQGIDFDQVYAQCIKPALEEAGFEVVRADEELRAGDIRADMFQELLLADLVVADLSIDNANVWYELGVRHALRARGVIQIQCRRDPMPFDVYTDRSLRYHLREGATAAVPDPDRLSDDKKKLAQFAMETIHSWYDRKVSPVYHLLGYLKEPDWKSLRVEEAREFWEEYESWAARIEVARKRNRPDDILVFADEAPTRVFRVEACRTAGKALLSLGEFKFALAQYENALAIKPGDMESRRQKGLLLGRLKKIDQAEAWIDSLVREFPEDAETWALRGRMEKEAWVNNWRAEGKASAAMRREAAQEEGRLRDAIDAYLTGYRKQPAHHYSGINALTLMCLQRHLGGNDDRRAIWSEMEGALRWGLRGQLEKEPRDYWARVTLADLEVLVGARDTVEDAYQNAVVAADNDWFQLSSSRQQLSVLRDLEFRGPEVGAALAIIDRELSKIDSPEKGWSPRQVFLFSGHMVDAPDRSEPRFPADREKIAAAAIAAKLNELGAGPEDLGFCGGACGGDILFAEACLSRGARLEVRIPFDEPAFLQQSVAFAGGDWVNRYYRMKADPHARFYVAPEELGPPPNGVNPYARNNLWQLYAAFSWGPDRIRFLCLWNRKGSDGKGGTQHMVETVQRYSGRVYVLDTNQLW